jgi:hypothetical protein
MEVPKKKRCQPRCLKYGPLHPRLMKKDGREKMGWMGKKG